MNSWSPKEPYQNLPKLPPSVEVETKSVLKQCITSRAALAELNEATRQIPNPSVLINTLPLLEARASSEIENIVTTTDKLFEHVSNDTNADPATKEALRYSRALFYGFESLEKHPLNTRTSERVCTQIKGVEMSVRRVPGTALSNDATGEIIYTPPEGEEHLRDLLGNWEKYIHSDDSVDPLILLAVSHYQFEAIHPFTDGNGRTGRIINSLFLIERELLRLPVLYLSRYILENRGQYNRSLLNVTKENDWEALILFMLRGIEETANWTSAKVAAIRNLEKHTIKYVKTSLPKIYSYELVDLVFELPYCRINNVVEKGIAKRQAASQYLKRLVEIGVLIEMQSGREKLFVHPKFMRLLSRDSNDFQTY